MSKINQNIRSGRIGIKTLLLSAAMLASGAIFPAALRGDAKTQPVAETTQNTESTTLHVDLKVNQTQIITTKAPILNVVGPEQEIVWVNKPDNSQDTISLAGRKPGSVQMQIVDIHGHSQTLEVVVMADLEALQAEVDKVVPDHTVKVSSANGAIVLRGHVPSVDLSDKVVQVAGPFGTKVINLIDVNGGQQITLQVRFAEVDKDVISQLGVNFGVAASGGFGANVIGGVGPLGITTATNSTVPLLSVGSPSSNVTGFINMNVGKTPFDVFIAALRQNNLLRVLAEPNLTTVSGSQATFLAGGEYPYPVPQSGGAGGGSTTITIAYKEYGVRLAFTPVVLGNGKVRLHVMPEVSDLDYTHSVTLQGFVVPGLTTRNADTTVELAEGQTLAMAGLLETKVTGTNSITPLLGDLPVIGMLFRSVRYERSETELVVFVTPVLASGMNPDQVPPLPGEYWRYPTEPEVFVNQDMGGPLADTAHAPTNHPPRQFQGSYGFEPAPASTTVNGK